MASFNSIIIMGNLTRDPQLSYLPSGSAVCEVGLATNRKWTDKSGAVREETCFIDGRAYGKQAETIQKWFTKGKPILIEGRLTFDQWEAQDGTKRSKHRINIVQFTFVNDGQRPPAMPGNPNSPQPPPAFPSAAQAPQAPQGGDIPF